MRNLLFSPLALTTPRYLGRNHNENVVFIVSFYCEMLRVLVCAISGLGWLIRTNK